MSGRLLSMACSDVDAIAAGAEHMLSRCRERAGIVDAILKAIDQSETVRKLVIGSESAAAAHEALKDKLAIDDVGTRAVLDMQMRRLAGRERKHVADECDELAAQIADLESILASPERLQALIGTPRGDYLAGLPNRQ